MLYRTKIDLAFPQNKEGRKSFESALSVFMHAVNINPGTINQEQGFIRYCKCYHDENPNAPCEVIEEYFVTL